jgi:hypothetical protein
VDFVSLVMREALNSVLENRAQGRNEKMSGGIYFDLLDVNLGATGQVANDEQTIEVRGRKDGACYQHVFTFGELRRILEVEGSGSQLILTLVKFLHETLPSYVYAYIGSRHELIYECDGGQLVLERVKSWSPVCRRTYPDAYVERLLYERNLYDQMLGQRVSEREHLDFVPGADADTWVGEVELVETPVNLLFRARARWEDLGENDVPCDLEVTLLESDKVMATFMLYWCDVACGPTKSELAIYESSCVSALGLGGKYRMVITKPKGRGGRVASFSLGQIICS